ncbi:MFS general substrate transporter [Neolentinus lepideus HHB14362 ss-1]|uniref:MFS general substrate transporter n=1 Tax=Neolentinus lepideus HHB14362 ss-1 TaxID=1314782 RepID=A0A165RGS9_9AGAM|nr:MFS general substrate transporter [Neolentinus lepideus HHB14362 ss-1]
MSLTHSESLSLSESDNGGTLTPCPNSPQGPDERIKESSFMDTWDTDGQNPYNWPLRKSAVNAILVCFLGFLSSLVSSIIVPALPNVMQEFGITIDEVGTLTTSLFVLGLGVGPFLFAPLSELYGRMFVYRLTMSAFTVLQIGCALSNSMATLIILRFFSGIFGSAPPSLGQATISDLFSPATRAPWSALYSLGPMLGPCLGPLIASLIVSAKSWRWVFWTSACVSAGGTALLFIVSVETYKPVIQRQVMKQELEKAYGKIGKRAWGFAIVGPDEKGQAAKGLYSKALSRPFRLLTTNPTCVVLGTFLAYVYGMLYLLLTSLPLLYRNGQGRLFSYNFSTISGLCYLGLAIGFIVASTMTAYGSTRLYNHLVKVNGEHRPEYRLLPMTAGMIILPIGLLMYGWSAHQHNFFMVPIIGNAFVAMGIFVTFQSIQVYLVDAFSPYSASAIAAATLLRCCAGCGLPLFGKQMFKALGYGWAATVLALATVPAIPIPLILYKYSRSLRERFPFHG